MEEKDEASKFIGAQAHPTLTTPLR